MTEQDKVYERLTELSDRIASLNTKMTKKITHLERDLEHEKQMRAGIYREMEGLREDLDPLKKLAQKRAGIWAGVIFLVAAFAFLAQAVIQWLLRKVT